MQETHTPRRSRATPLDRGDDCLQARGSKFGYESHLVSFAKSLRKRSTLAEVKLWQHLKGKQRGGYSFHRQKPLDRYIVDFWCSALALAIEVDGCSTHDSKIERDFVQQQQLESKGIRFLRFQEKDVQENLEACVTCIDQWILQHETAIGYRIRSMHRNIPSIKRGGA
jgi:very-short-patch-repair endonuclease